MEINDKRKLVIFIGIIIILCGVVFCGCGHNTSMTEEEFQAYRESCIHEYPLCSVMQYIKTKTNRFGGVIDTELCYAFTYIDETNTLKTVDNFTHLEYGLTKVTVGTEDKYVIDTYGETTKYLVLTQETLSSLSVKE